MSQVELAHAAPTPPFVAACDRALEAGGSLLALLPAAMHERDVQRHERAAARRAAADPALRWEALSDAGAQDVDPTNRRGLLGAGAAAALGGIGVAAAVPAQSRDIDPELPGHWLQLLSLLARYDAMFGPRDALDSVRREIGIIAEHRQAARGELRTHLLRVESRWAELAAWLSNDMGDHAARDLWTDRAIRLAREAGYRDMAAYLRSRQSQWAAQEHDARRAVAHAEAALRIRGTSAQTRALCAREAAHGYALAGDAAACERSLADAYRLVEHTGSPAPPWAGNISVTHGHIRRAEARCWLELRPVKAVALYESVVREWPRDRMRTGGLQRARLALAYAATGERDRAISEGRKALAIARSTGSSMASLELKRLGRRLVA